MSLLSWLAQLPADDDAFIPLHRTEVLCDADEYQLLEAAHRQAVVEASQGLSLKVLEEHAASLRQYAERQAERENWPEDKRATSRDALEAEGYAMGVTAVRVALRAHRQEDMAAAS